MSSVLPSSVLGPGLVYSGSEQKSDSRWGMEEEEKTGLRAHMSPAIRQASLNTRGDDGALQLARLAVPGNVEGRTRDTRKGVVVFLRRDLAFRRCRTSRKAS